MRVRLWFTKKKVLTVENYEALEQLGYFTIHYTIKKTHYLVADIDADIRGYVFTCTWSLNQLRDHIVTRADVCWQQLYVTCNGTIDILMKDYVNGCLC